MINNVKIELCANTVDDVLISAGYPFDTIELNCGTEIDGLTPSLSFLIQAKKLSSAKMQVMIRPRAGGFCYSEILYEQMKNDLKLFLDYGADGIVFGFTTDDLKIDKNRTKEFIEIIHSYGKTATFHKAIDVIDDLEDALDFLNEVKIDRILTAPCNVLPIKNRYPEIEVIAGGGIKNDNIEDYLAKGIDHFHFTAKKIMSDKFGAYHSVDEDELQKIISKIGKG